MAKEKKERLAMVVKALLEFLNSGVRTMYFMQLERNPVSKTKEKERGCFTTTFTFVS